MKGANMSNATAQMVTHGQVSPRRKKKAQWFRLRLVIDEVDDLDTESTTDSRWLGHFSHKSRAITARNEILVMLNSKTSA